MKQNKEIKRIKNLTSFLISHSTEYKKDENAPEKNLGTPRKGYSDISNQVSPTIMHHILNLVISYSVSNWRKVVTVV